MHPHPHVRVLTHTQTTGPFTPNTNLPFQAHKAWLSQAGGERGWLKESSETQAW